MLQSPRFLYRVEMGMPDLLTGQPDVTALDSWEVATRLSFLLWSSIPDEELFAAAEADALGDAASIEKQARRMLEDPRARDAVANFHEQWLGLGKIGTLNKDVAVYPTYTPALRPLWEKETLSFLDHVVFDDDKGDVKTMLTAPYSMMNADLAAFYGVSGPKGAAFERVDLDPAQRAGLLTQASLLAVNSKPNQSSPIHRGKFVRERLLCQTLAPPPNNVNIQPPEVDPTATTREKFSQHSSDPACAGCHRLMDPIGFGFESYDGIGQFRTRIMASRSTPRGASPTRATATAPSTARWSWRRASARAPTCASAWRRSGSASATATAKTRPTPARWPSSRRPFARPTTT